MKNYNFLLLLIIILLLSYYLYNNENFTSIKSSEEYKFNLSDNISYNTLENDVKEELLSKYNIYQNEKLNEFNTSALQYEINIL